MRRLWRRLRAWWADFWEQDEYDTSKKHLSQADKRGIWYGTFLVCAIAIVISVLSMRISYYFSAKDTSEDVEKILNTIAAYMASATDEEYEEITDSLRNDLLLSQFSQDATNFIEYIPNTATECCVDFEELQDQGYQGYILCTNTGELYPIDLYSDGEQPGDIGHGTLEMSGGYDEVSGSNFWCRKDPDNQIGYISFYRDRGILSIQRMKGLLCDDCIEKIITSVYEESIIPEFAFIDPAQEAFYPIQEGTIEIGDYQLEISNGTQLGNYSVEYRYINIENE